MPRPGRFTPAKETRYLLYRKLGGSQDQSVRVWKIQPPHRDKSPYPPASCVSLYRLSYRIQLQHNDTSSLQLPRHKFTLLTICLRDCRKRYDWKVSNFDTVSHALVPTGRIKSAGTKCLYLPVRVCCGRKRDVDNRIEIRATFVL